MSLDTYIVAAVHVGGVLAVAIPVIYFLFLPWKDTAGGRASMVLSCALAALFVVSILGFWIPSLPGFDVAYAVVVTGVVAALGWELYVIARLRFRSS